MQEKKLKNRAESFRADSDLRPILQQLKKTKGALTAFINAALRFYFTNGPKTGESLTEGKRMVLDKKAADFAAAFGSNLSSSLEADGTSAESAASKKADTELKGRRRKRKR